MKSNPKINQNLDEIKWGSCLCDIKRVGIKGASGGSLQLGPAWVVGDGEIGHVDPMFGLRERER